MLVRVCIRRCFVALCGVVSLAGAGCAGTMSKDETMAELARLRTAVQQSEERVMAMQAQQAELTRQLEILSAFLGAYRDEMARKKQGFTGNPAASVSMPIEPTKKPESPDLEF